MADIAAVFGWAPSEMGSFSLGDLMRWHGLALDRVPKAR